MTISNNIYFTQHGIAKSGAEVQTSTFVLSIRKNHFLFAEIM